MDQIDVKAARLRAVGSAMHHLEDEVAAILTGPDDVAVAARLCPFDVGEIVNYDFSGEAKPYRVVEIFAIKVRPFWRVYGHKVNTSGTDSKTPGSRQILTEPEHITKLHEPTYREARAMIEEGMEKERKQDKRRA